MIAGYVSVVTRSWPLQGGFVNEESLLEGSDRRLAVRHDHFSSPVYRFGTRAHPISAA